MPSAFPSMLLASGRPMTLRGAGHSCYGQTVADGELLVTYAPDGAAMQVRDVGGGLFEVPAGMSWYGLERYLNGRGRAVSVLPNYLHMSVGGTLSVGGIGVGSVRHGMQVDQVERIQLIDGTGVSRWCSRIDHPELFRFALGGLGMVGLIERVVLRTVPYQLVSHLHHTHQATLTEFIEHTERIAQRDDVDLFSASLRPDGFSTTTGWVAGGPTRCGDEHCAIGLDLPFAGHFETTQMASPSGQHVRLWTDYVVPAAQFAPMLAAVEEQRHRAPLNRVLTMLYILIVRRPHGATPFAFAPVDTAPVSIGVGLYTTVERDPAAIAATRRTFRCLLELCCELGGRPYLYGVSDLGGALAQQLYGADLNRLAQLRACHRLEHINAHLPLSKVALQSPG